MPSVEYRDLEMAMEFVSGGSFIDAHAYISRESGKIYWESDDSDPDQEIPDEVSDPDLYAEVPDKRDLGLGKPLVLKFAAHFLHGNYEEIDRMFRHNGAYSRFKEFLYENGKLEEWYEFEQSAIERELIAWAESEGFIVVKDASETAT